MEEKNGIILSIKPEFVEKILCGEKRYEYRKRLCKKTIHKIYIYETRPVKSIVGEAEIIRKMSLDKEELWEETKCASGISKEAYDEYFKSQSWACAYEIDSVKKYKKPITLESIGVKSVPQSFVYCGDLDKEV